MSTMPRMTPTVIRMLRVKIAEGGLRPRHHPMHAFEGALLAEIAWDDELLGEGQAAFGEGQTRSLEPLVGRRYAPAAGEDRDAAMAEIEEMARGEVPGPIFVHGDDVVGDALDVAAAKHGRDVDLRHQAGAVRGVRAGRVEDQTRRRAACASS